MPDAAPRSRPRAVLLCAGGSTRMGRPKALLPWNGATLLEVHLAALHDWDVRVVLGAGHTRLIPLLGDVPWVHNPDWQHTPMGVSARLGAVGTQGPALFVPIDTVPEPPILARLRERTVSTVPLDTQGRRGHPVLLSAADVTDLLVSADPNLRDYALAATTLPTSSSLCALDFDTPEALARMREEVARGGLEPPTPRV